jgi:phage gp29-like protein
MSLLRTLAARLGLAAAPPTNPPPRPRLGYEPTNLSSTATSATIQAAIRSAEAGDTRNLFTLFRDWTYDSHVAAELGKRKLAVLCQTWTLVPHDPKNPADVRARDAIDQMISRCPAWNDSLVHLLDGVLWPVAVGAKVFRAGSDGLRYELEQIARVDPSLFCFYQSTFTRNENDAQQWEPDLRLYPVAPNGAVTYSWTAAQPLDPMRHVVHRGHLMTGQRDNFGGPFRSIGFWIYLRSESRYWFARTMERYGMPFVVGKVDASDAPAVTMLETAFAEASRLFGLVVDQGTQIEMKEIALSGTADAHERFLQLCNREISLVIVGQTLSSQAQPTGLGSGTAALQGQVRADVTSYDKLTLAETLRQQLFRSFLEINGIQGEPPRILWGGDDEAKRATIATLLVQIAGAGLEPADDALPGISETLGFQVQRKAVAPVPPAFGPRTFAAVRPLSAQVAVADAVGVPASWLDPVAEFLTNLEAKARDGSLTDVDLLDFLTKAQARIPELLGKMDMAALAAAMEKDMGNAVLAGARDGIGPLPLSSSFDPNQPRDDQGQWTDSDDSSQSITINSTAKTLEIRRTRIVGSGPPGTPEFKRPKNQAAVQSIPLPADRNQTMELLRKVHAETGGGKNFGVHPNIEKGWAALGLKRA